MSADAQKLAASERALDFLEPGMRLGLGTGSTAEKFVDLVGARVADGLDLVCVPTSETTRSQAKALGVRLTNLDETPELDLTVDGADELDGQLCLIKGGGGALLREKIVAAASKKMVVIADASKLVKTLGQFALPVEVMPFGLRATLGHVEETAHAAGCEGKITLRQAGPGNHFVTDSGNHIVDCAFGQIADPAGLAAALSAIPGVVEHGLFLGMATTAIVAGDDGVDIITAG
jgi:ribose 5-phosphate isomerase A